MKFDVYEPETITAYLSGWEREALEYGDYHVSGTGNALIAIERKTWSDLLGSLADHRLNDQLFRCLTAADTTVLLIEGWATSTHDGYVRLQHGVTGWLWSAVQGYLLSVQMSGVRIYLTSNETETVRCLLGMPAFFAKPRHLALLKAPKLVPKSSEYRALNLLAGLEGVDIELAKRLLEQFSTPRNVFNATEAELLKVHGIGRVKASAIRRSLDEAYTGEADRILQGDRAA